MRSRFHNQIIAGFLALSIFSYGELAWAERLSPAGDYVEAKLESSSAESQGSIKDRALAKVEEVKTWVKSKWTEIKKTYFAEEEQAMLNAGSDQVPQQAPQRVAAPVRAPIERTLQAPEVPQKKRDLLDTPGVTRTSTGVASYDLSAAPHIPRLDLEAESRISVSQYALDSRLQKIMNERVVRPLESPDVLTQNELKALITLRVPRAGQPRIVQMAKYPDHLKGRLDGRNIERIVVKLKPENELQLKKFVPLTPDELRFLSGLYLLQNGEQCPTAIGLFHRLSKSKGWEAEANYYLARCSKRLKFMSDYYEHVRRVLETQDVFYSRKLLAEVGSDIPYEAGDGFGNALLKVLSNQQIMKGLSPEVMADIAYVLADFGVTSGRYKTALTWAARVPETHPKYHKARFLLALAEYQVGSKENAAKIQDEIVNDKKIDKSKLEFQALVALNAARMHFQERNFKLAHENFRKVYKDHPLWLQSLTEFGWSQLMDGDYEGAIGNMHSIQSPFFSAVYKPESYVIRTIGYLNLCQYGDAYRTLTRLEHDYRPYLEKMETYLKKNNGKNKYYETVKSFFKATKETKEIDGLPMPVVREMARHRDFTNLQKALNRLIDERPHYNIVNGDVERRLKSAQADVNATRKRIDSLRRNIALATKNKSLAPIQDMKRQLEEEFLRLNDQFFAVDLYREAKDGIEQYRVEVIGGADKRIAAMRDRIEQVLSNRLLRMKVELARMLDNNELLRYEAFAGSGENIRFQVAGGEAAKRVPASVVPKSKALQWDFDGEYWEDEIGHFRSSLKNKCPDKRSQASLDGGIK